MQDRADSRLAPSGVTTAFRHEALLYSGETQFLAGALGFIRDGLAAGENVLVAVGEEKIDRLRRRLAPHAGEVSFVDMAESGRNPATIIPLWSEFVERNRPTGRPFRGIGEPAWPGRSDAAMVECRNHEALVNIAFSDSPSWCLMCAYDEDGLNADVIADVRTTHPHLLSGDERFPSAEFDPHSTGWLERDDLLLSAAAETQPIAFGPNSLGAIRSVVGAYAAGAGLAPLRVDDFVLAINELVGNSLRHGGGAGELRLWVESEIVLAEVRDRGSITDPLVGRHWPSPEQVGGRGLWIANQVCDLVQIRSGGGSTVVRVHMAR